MNISYSLTDVYDGLRNIEPGYVGAVVLDCMRAPQVRGKILLRVSSSMDPKQDMLQLRTVPGRLDE